MDSMFGKDNLMTTDLIDEMKAFDLLHIMYEDSYGGCNIGC